MSQVVLCKNITDTDKKNRVYAVLEKLFLNFQQVQKIMFLKA